MGTHPTKIALLIGSLCSVSMIAPAVAADETHAANVDEHIVVIGRADKTPLNIAANVNVIDAAAIVKVVFNCPTITLALALRCAALAPALRLTTR